MPEIDKILQKDILSIFLRDKQLVSKFARVIDHTFFTTKYYRYICKLIFNHYNRFDGELISKKNLLLDINKNIPEDKRNAYRKRLLPLFEREVKGHKGLSSEIFEWIEKQRFGQLLEQASELGTEGKLDESKELIKSSFLFNISDEEFEIYSFFEEWKQRQRERKLEKLSKKTMTLITDLGEIDDYMIIKENVPVMALIMGTSGVGKSITSINMGACGIISGFKVAHFVFENTARQTLDRYDSRFLKYPYFNIKEFLWSKRLLTLANKTMRRFRRLKAHYLKVFHAPIDSVGIPDVESILKNLEIKENWIPNMIIYDSPDHMQPSRRQESYRLEVKKTYADVKRQSEIRQIPILCTTHAKSAAKGTRVKQEAASESYDKARLADIMTTISQSQEQLDDHQAELWLDKNRDGESNIGVLVDLLYRVMTIKYVERLGHDRGEIEESEDED